MAQLAEQLICNQQVIGSSPIIGFVLIMSIQYRTISYAIYGWIPEWPKGTDCKSAANCFGGSNPPPSICLMAIQYYIAGWSSLEARRAHNPKVAGSNPAPAIYAQIAQLVEQRTENPRVTGSIPVLGIYGVLAQSVEHLTFNQVVRGSNPRCLIKKRLEVLKNQHFYFFACELLYMMESDFIFV